MRRLALWARMRLESVLDEVDDTWTTKNGIDNRDGHHVAFRFWVPESQKEINLYLYRTALWGMAPQPTAARRN